MATKKKVTSAGHDKWEPPAYDRWDTFSGTTKGTGQPLTDRQKKAIERVQKKQNAMKKKK